MVEVPRGLQVVCALSAQRAVRPGLRGERGASFLCFDGSPWSTDKDGPLMCLLAAEIMAKEQASPSEIYQKCTEKARQHRSISVWTRPARRPHRALLKALDAGERASENLGRLAGDQCADPCARQ